MPDEIPIVRPVLIVPEFREGWTNVVRELNVRTINAWPEAKRRAAGLEQPQTIVSANLAQPVPQT